MDKQYNDGVKKAAEHFKKYIREQIDAQNRRKGMKSVLVLEILERIEMKARDISEKADNDDCRDL